MGEGDGEGEGEERVDDIFVMGMCISDRSFCVDSGSEDLAQRSCC